METPAVPNEACRLMEALPGTSGRGQQRSQPTLVLLVVLLLVCRAVCAAEDTACPAGCSCQRNGAEVSCVGLSSIPRIRKRPSRILALRITQHRITRLSSGSFRGLQLLEELEITGGRLSEISHDAFSSLNNLKRVNLSHNELTLLPRDTLKMNWALQQLDLSWNPLVLPARGSMLASESLSILDISFCSLRKLPDEVFSEVPSLTELRLRGNVLQNVSECILEPLKKMVLIDIDHTIHWTICPLRELTNQDYSDSYYLSYSDLSGALQFTYQNYSNSEQEPGVRQSSDDVVTFLQMAFIPTMLQLIFIIVAVVFLALLVTCIYKACQQAQRREKHVYEFLGGSLTAQLPSIPSHNFRTSRISTNSCDLPTAATSVSLGDAESQQYLPHLIRPGVAFQL